MRPYLSNREAINFELEDMYLAEIGLVDYSMTFDEWYDMCYAEDVADGLFDGYEDSNDDWNYEDSNDDWDYEYFSLMGEPMFDVSAAWAAYHDWSEQQLAAYHDWREQQLYDFSHHIIEHERHLYHSVVGDDYVDNDWVQEYEMYLKEQEQEDWGYYVKMLDKVHQLLNPTGKV